MSMIFRAQRATTEQCPWCRFENETNTDGAVECQNCSRTYQRIEEINEIDICDKPGPKLRSTDVRATTEQSLSPQIPRPPRRQSNDEDMNLYTRVQLVNTKFCMKAHLEVRPNARLITISQHDLENPNTLAEYLTEHVDGLSEEECLRALAESGITLRPPAPKHDIPHQRQKTTTGTCSTMPLAHSSTQPDDIFNHEGYSSSFTPNPYHPERIALSEEAKISTSSKHATMLRGQEWSPSLLGVL
ncbi:hypothetical protein BJX66DRAFT_336113 [Aspergillus keveii]|uniref:RanBP2-type domain-containing protein n=1 Tax=Aspergillus keveii TaxID=714993 RepID=A0ABR4GCI6_9EURO